MMRRFMISILVAIGALSMAILLPAGARTAAQDQTTVSMADFEFKPPDITVNVGQSIVWKNDGAKKHTATADDTAFDTDVVAPGASSQPIKFDKAGTFKYFCQFHGGPGGVDMAGTITVVDAAPAQPAAATAAPVAPAATEVAAKPVGNVTFADKGKGAHGDSVTFTMTNLPLPEEGKQYEAWLSNPTSWFSLGKLDVKADGTATLNFVDPKGANLLGLYQSALISEQGNTLTPAGPILFSGTLPPQALVHVRHVAVSFPDTPDKAGLMAGALDQENVLTQHVVFMNDAIAKGNVALAKRHLEHIHNLMTGTNGAKDLDGNGKLEVIPPGDGFGIFNYLTTAVQHVDLAAKQADASSNIKVKGNHVKITAANATGNLTQIQTLAVQGSTKTTIADLKTIAAQITKLNDAVLKGVPDASGGVSPTKGSGGLAIGYAEGLAMGSIAILPGDITGGKGEPAPGGAAPAATEAAAAPAAAADTVTVVVKDFEFVDKTVTIKPGQSVIFVNQGAKKHTATADDSSFDTGVLAPGASSQPIAFPNGGTFAYFCQFHGGPGGLDMAGVVEVK